MRAGTPALRYAVMAREAEKGVARGMYGEGWRFEACAESGEKEPAKSYATVVGMLVGRGGEMGTWVGRWGWGWGWGGKGIYTQIPEIQITVHTPQIQDPVIPLPGRTRHAQ